VLLVDVRRPAGVMPDGVEAVVADISSAQDVSNALRGVTLVFHLASYGGY
jgi:uncharacterized protein YbjT (DUF2867 family)